MPTYKKPAPKRKAPAEIKRKAMNKKKEGIRKKSPLSKKKLTNSEAAAILKKEAKARQIKRMNRQKGKRTA